MTQKRIIRLFINRRNTGQLSNDDFRQLLMTPRPSQSKGGEGGGGGGGEEGSGAVMTVEKKTSRYCQLKYYV